MPQASTTAATIQTAGGPTGAIRLPALRDDPVMEPIVMVSYHSYIGTVR
jgi:hypothetical protein